MRELGGAFLQHPANEELRTALHTGALDVAAYYRELLRLVFRVVLVDSLSPRLWAGGEGHGSLWQTLQPAIECIGPRPCPHLQDARCDDTSLARALGHLVGSESGDHLDVETLGAVYERLLQHEPMLEWSDAATPVLRLELAGSEQRKGAGCYYTPPELVDALLEVTLVPAVEERLRAARTGQEKEAALLGLRVCDPACGSGRFLLAAARQLTAALAKIRGSGAEPAETIVREARRDVIRSCIYGVDRDPMAVDLCRAALWAAEESGWRATGAVRGELPPFLDQHVVCADALLDLVGPERSATGTSSRRQEVFSHDSFDVVLGNPPYVDSERLTRERGDLRKLVAAAYPSARGNWDLYVPFVELAARLTRPGGMFALVTPGKLLASDYCAAIQRMVLALTPMVCLDFGAARPFRDANVSVMVLAVRKMPGEPGTPVEFSRYGTRFQREETVVASLAELRDLPPGFIAAPLSMRDTRLISPVRDGVPLTSLAVVADGASTAEAYRIRSWVWDGAPEANGDAVRLVNTGTIDPFRILWGARSIRYLGFRGRYPVVSRGELARIAPRRLEQADRVKVLVGGMGDRIEAVVASAGVLCGKSAILILPFDGICPFALAAVLNSEVVNAIYRGLFGLRGFSQRSMALGPRQIERLPMPPIEALAPDLLRGSASDGDVMKPSEATYLAAASAGELCSRVLHEALLSQVGRALHHPAVQGDLARYEALLRLAERSVLFALG